MTTTKDLILKYEVLKLQTGAEVVGMTRDLSGSSRDNTGV